MNIQKTKLLNILILLVAIVLTAVTTALICYRPIINPVKPVIVENNETPIIKLKNSINMTESQKRAYSNLTTQSDKLNFIAQILKEISTRSLQERIKIKLEKTFEYILNILNTFNINQALQDKIREALMKIIKGKSEKIAKLVEEKIRNSLNDIDISTFDNIKQEVIDHIKIFSPAMAGVFENLFNTNVLTGEFVKNLIKLLLE